MKPAKYSKSDTNKIDLNTKVIFKYPTPTRDFDIGKMVVHGRHPETTSTFIIEEECSFVIYVLSGDGKVYVGEEIYLVKSEDVVYVPKKFKFAVEGSFEYVTFDSPAYFVEQSTLVTA